MTTKLGPCSEKVSPRNDSWSRYPCGHSAKVVENGKPYCTIHAPSYVNAKHAKAIAASDAKWDAIHAERQDRAHRIECYPELLAALELALPAIRWGLTHQPGNLVQLQSCEVAVVFAINKARGTSELAHDKG